MLRILIADDHAVVRRGLKQILSESFPNVEVGEAADGFSFLKLARGGDWDAVVLDITMPGRNGLDLLAELKKLRQSLPVLVLTMHSEDQYAVRALRAGASGYMTKESAPEELAGAIKRIVGGGRYVSTTLAEKLACQISNGGDKSPEEALSDREYEVMLRIASGKTVGEIADELSLSTKTISTYRVRALEKMGMTSNSQLTRYAFEKQLLK